MHNRLITSYYKANFHKYIQEKEGIRRINFNFGPIYTCIKA